MPAPVVITTTGEAVDTDDAQQQPQNRTLVGMLSLERFPVADSGHPQFAQRFDDGPRGHKGTDIFAPRGTPVLAVRDGTAQNAIEPRGGNVVYLTATDGARYFYGHLDRWALQGGGVVKAGDTLGFVGNTGNAAGRDTHLHFQMAEKAGGDPVDPFPYLVSVAPPGAARSSPNETPRNTAIAVTGGGLLWMAGLWWLFKSGSSRRRQRA